ncbi:glycosyl transferase [Legionella tunisiensis]|uniref:glycosyl transferase n=1 Tax=Legionella tunisiensis TaxID=1034944 RepID=UPI0018DDA8E7|nr:glycosyl transferase [Legionella tunisiensis]
MSEAHRSHAYQHASRRYRRHLPVTVGILMINLLWLLPWALLVGAGYLNGSLGLLIAYSPLVVLALKFNAGKRE